MTAEITLANAELPVGVTYFSLTSPWLNPAQERLVPPPRDPVLLLPSARSVAESMAAGPLGDPGHAAKVVIEDSASVLRVRAAQSKTGENRVYLEWDAHAGTQGFVLRGEKPSLAVRNCSGFSPCKKVNPKEPNPAAVAPDVDPFGCAGHWEHWAESLPAAQPWGTALGRSG